MTLAAVREKLHEYIDHADDNKVKAMFTLVENDMEPEHEFTEAELEELDKRREDYLSGKTKSIPWEESRKKIRKYLENKKNSAL